MTPTGARPDRSEAADYFFRYIDLVPDGDIVTTLEAQHGETLGFLRAIPVARASFRYAPDKWSVAEVVAHLNDCERLFAFRAMWFARALDAPLPSFDQNVAARHAGAEARDWQTHVDEFDAVRRATLFLFRHLPADAWQRRGVASDNPFTPRALAFVAAGHVIHHRRILSERYL